MLAVQRMFLLDILILQKDIEAVSQMIIETEYFEPSIYSSISSDQEKQWNHENISEKKKMISDLTKNLKELLVYFNPYAEIYPIKTQKYTIPMIGDTVRQYSLKKHQFEERYNVLKIQKEDLAIKIAGLRMHMNAKKNHEFLDDSEHTYSILGLINSTYLVSLENQFNRFKGKLITEGHVNESNIVFITIPKSQQQELITLLEQLYFINYGLPEEIFGNGMNSMMTLGLEYTLVCDQEDMLEIEIKKIAPAIVSTINNMLHSLSLYSTVFEIRQVMKQAGTFALLSGWVAQNNYKQLEKKLQNICGQNYELVITKTEKFDIPIDIPTKLQNPKWLKPFEQLVTTFGTPNYNELDPTIFFSILYIFMYGAMFGDVGQGVIMLMLGIFGKLIKKFKDFNMIFGIMIWVGLSSIVFGVLYGSYFGYESIYYSWVPAPLWISPMHNINTILLYSIIFGICVIVFSYILGIINAIRMKDWSCLIFSHKGLIAFIMYLLVLVMGYQYYISSSVSFILIITSSILTLFLGLERIWEALIYKHGSIKDWWMGFFDMFEFFLSMLTNTLSFVRIGAFALTHTALMTAVFTLRDLVGDNKFAAYLIVILGNIFVICMEGFIVGIQTLRLEYYEFFMRFFRGTGRVFKPIIRVNNKSLK